MGDNLVHLQTLVRTANMDKHLDGPSRMTHILVSKRYLGRLYHLHQFMAHMMKRQGSDQDMGCSLLSGTCNPVEPFFLSRPCNNLTDLEAYVMKYKCLGPAST